MARGRQFEISGKVYNATALKEEVSRIKSRLSYGEQITRGDADFEFMANLYDRYYPWKFDGKKPENSDKVMDLTVQRNMDCTYHSLTFYWILPDGGFENWQPSDCWKPRSNVSLARDAFRHAIKDQCFEKLVVIRRESGGKPIVCPVTNKEFWPQISGQAEVDHEPPEFSELLKSYLQDKGLELDKIQFERGNGTFLADKDLEKDFQEYHRKHAKLRVISKEGHKIKTYARKDGAT